MVAPATQKSEGKQKDMTDRSVIVTGAGSGIGAAMVRRFVALGDKVAALDYRVEAVEGVVAALHEGRSKAIEVDVGDPAAVSAAVSSAVAFLGGIDILCNNAGILDGYLSVLETPLELWQRVLATDLTGPFLMAKEVLPHMIEGGGGAIVNTASIAALVAGGGGAAYTSAKHGVLGLTKQLAFDYGRHNIRVNAICPGAVKTGMTASLFTKEGHQDHVDAAIAATPAGRWADPDEVAKLAAFLASDTAAFVHGSAYVIDGGWTVS